MLSLIWTTRGARPFFPAAAAPIAASGCPVGSFIRPRDYMSAMEGIPVRYIGKTPVEVPAYMDVGVAR